MHENEHSACLKPLTFPMYTLTCNKTTNLRKMNFKQQIIAVKLFFILANAMT